MQDVDNRKRVLWLAGVGAALVLGILFVTVFAGSPSTGYDPGVSLRPETGLQENTQSPPPQPVESDPQTQSFSLGAGDIVSLAWRLALVALIVAASLFALRWWARKTSGPKSQTGFLRVVDTLPVGNGRTIHLVALGDRVIVVGATQQSLGLLNELTPDEATQVMDEAVHAAEQPFGAFAGELMKNLRNTNSLRSSRRPLPQDFTPEEIV
jgi:flagellar protein FliO/FliZ